jgi:hypothetical protein
MINIELNDKYNITSDKLNFILQEKRISKKTNNVRLVDVGYYGEFQQLVNALIQKEIKESDVTSLKELGLLINTVTNEITKRLDVLINVC